MYRLVIDRRIEEGAADELMSRLEGGVIALAKRVEWRWRADPGVLNLPKRKGGMVKLFHNIPETKEFIQSVPRDEQEIPDLLRTSFRISYSIGLMRYAFLDFLELNIPPALIFL